jgi:hypothetical protein
MEIQESFAVAIQPQPLLAETLTVPPPPAEAREALDGRIE